jgi:aminocarboxymuconate-semialdehyde decarboxylase
VIVAEILRNGRNGREPWRPRVKRDGSRPVVELGGREIRSMTREVVDVETILAGQERLGIDRVLLSPWVPLLYPEAEPEACLERCRIQNEALEGLAQATPDRIAALGAVPLQAPELAAAELGSLAAAGLLSGVEVTASVGGTYIGDPRFEPFWAAAERTRAVVFVHPTTRGFDDPVFGRHYLWNAVGNPFETTIAAAEMTMAGVLERHPGLRVILAHGGGALLALRGRLRHAHEVRRDARSDLVESPLDSIRRFHFDTVTHDRDLLRAMIDWAGADRVLLGSDYPFDMADPAPVDTVKALGLEDEVEGAVLGGNAERLLVRSTVDA